MGVFFVMARLKLTLWILFTFLICFLSLVRFCFAFSKDEVENKDVAIQWLYPPKYHRGNNFSEGRAWVQEKRDGPWTLLDDLGQVLKNDFQASYIDQYVNGYAGFKPLDNENQYGLLDRSGDVVLMRDTREAGLPWHGDDLVTKKASMAYTDLPIYMEIG